MNRVYLTLFTLFLMLCNIFIFRLKSFVDECNFNISSPNIVIPRMESIPESKRPSPFTLELDELALMSNKCYRNQDDVDKVCSEFSGANKCDYHVREELSYKTSFHDNLKGCKTLWFVSFHEGSRSRCDKAGYRFDYATALSSWKIHAHDALQPVLLLGRLGLNASEEISALRQWAAKTMGSIVLLIDKLSFQDDIYSWHSDSLPFDYAMGPYMRLDIPKIIEKHNLFNLQGICKPYVLYTDADILFVNPISPRDIEQLITEITSPQVKTGLNMHNYRHDNNSFLMFGREIPINHPYPANTGVMVMDVPRFSQQLPNMIKFRNEHPQKEMFTSYDQGWLKLYFEKYQGISLLPLYWNWKLYWRLRPSLWSDLKIVHFHGPKPNSGLRNISDCLLGRNVSDSRRFYTKSISLDLALRAICCDDYAKTSTLVFQLYDFCKPSYEDVC